MATATQTRPAPQQAPPAPAGADTQISMSTDAGPLAALAHGAEVDVQIATARRYPREISVFLKQAEALATLNAEVAASCFYALPRDGKTVEGPSARLAEIIASCWGHMRIAAAIVHEDARFITSRGMSWDVQNNVAISYDVRRRITGRDGRTYKDDMIVVTANAASSIALRNAVFKVIPSAFWRPIYEKCRKVAVGDQKTLAVRRADQLAYLQKMGIEPARVFAVLGVKAIEDITLEHMATLHGLATALKEGDTTIDEAFPAVAPVVPMPKRTSEGNGNGGTEAGQPAPQSGTTAPAAPAAETPATTAPATTAPAADLNVLPDGADRIIDTAKIDGAGGKPYWKFATKRGVIGYTWSADLGAQLDTAKESGALVVVVTALDGRNQHKLTSLEPFGAGI